MGDSEAVMEQTPYSDASVTAASDAGGSAAQATENMVGPASATVSSTGVVVSSDGSMNTDDSAAHGSDTGAGKAYGTAVNSVQQENPTVMAYDANENPAGPANSSLDSAKVAGYDTSLNGNGVSEAGAGATAGITENGVTPADGIGSGLHQPLDGSGLNAEEERLWSIVTANSLDFNAWTALIEETERMSEPNFLYAMVTGRSMLIMRRASAQWTKLQRFMNELFKELPTLWTCGCIIVFLLLEHMEILTPYSYLQQRLLKYKMSHSKVKMACMPPPLTSCVRFFSGRFKELVASRPLPELRTAEEAAVAAGANTETAGQENEGEVPPTAPEQSSKAVSASLKDEELEKYIAIREEIYKKAKDFDSKIIGFETAIRRPYFHVRPLNAAELENWHNYLDFIEGGGDFNKAKYFKLSFVSRNSGFMIV
ncbi:Pre-processing factor 39 [Sesamum angolense]|uniref:Pre-processing factor 39 n=1 Tax=Sesamum angolense TaxID=2727404 RepID=A0AAE2C360_9LAMI|nr:Pre-processing factor 39 [Sesamum angolense]